MMCCTVVEFENIAIRSVLGEMSGGLDFSKDGEKGSVLRDAIFDESPLPDSAPKLPAGEDLYDHLVTEFANCSVHHLADILFDDGSMEAEVPCTGDSESCEGESCDTNAVGDDFFSHFLDHFAAQLFPEDKGLELYEVVEEEWAKLDDSQRAIWDKAAPTHKHGLW